MDADAVECVYSSEEQVTEMLPLSKEQEESPGEFGVVDNFRYGSKQQITREKYPRVLTTEIYKQISWVVVRRRGQLHVW